jgi:hypothetical protein
MHPDDLNTMWLCCECGRKFVFHSDVDDHEKQMSHSKMVLYDLGGGRKSPVQFTHGRVSLGFRIKGRVSRVIVEYKYYPSTGVIHYVDVRYSDGGLQSTVEGNADMMKNIDNYLRRILKPGKDNMAAFSGS